ncbi:MAG TPA: DUF6340 family protein [Mucilaginibacter sp.]|nr:DUF6340 family protein [Mucilaginibacter sp.]
MEAAKTAVGLLLAILVTIASNNHNSTSYITVPINYTARYFFARDTATILVINQFDVKSVKDSSGKKPEVLAGAAFTSVKFIGSQLDLLPHIRVISLVDSLNFPVNTDSIKNLASKYKATHVLALKSFDANIVPTADQTGEKNLNTSISVDFKLYESNGLFYKKLHGTASDIIPDAKYKPQTDGAQPSISQYKAIVDTSSESAAMDALKDYFPSSVSHDRPIYTDHFLTKGVEKLYAGDPDAAIKFLEPYLQDKNAKKASKAAYMLAIAYETKGNIEKAGEMATLSLNKFNNPYATTMLQDLKDE